MLTGIAGPALRCVLRLIAHPPGLSLARKRARTLSGLTYVARLVAALSGELLNGAKLNAALVVPHEQPGAYSC